MRVIAGVATIIIILQAAIIVWLYTMPPPTPSPAPPISGITEQLPLISAKLEAIEEKLAALAMTKTSAPTKDVEDVFEGKTDSETLNEIKSRFEGLFVNYQYLQRCGTLAEADYHILNSALMHELTSNNAPARLQYDILTAAQGTYEEIYARSECDEASVATIQEGFRAYMDEAAKVGFVIER